MGAWGVLAFDNDDANDWADGLGADLVAVESAFDAVEVSDGYVEAPTASAALAACEVLARLLGHAGHTSGSTERVDQWVADHPQAVPGPLLTRAVTVIDRVVADDSELAELWSESPRAGDWAAAVADLRGRLTP